MKKNNIEDFTQEFAKKSYKKPELKEIGRVIELTQTTNGGSSSDNPGAPSSKLPPVS